MRRVDLATMLEAPVGCLTREGPFLVWSWSPQLCGIMYTSRIGDEYLPLLKRAVRLPFHPDLARPYRAVVDVSQTVEIGPGVFAYLIGHVNEMRAEGMLSRLAVVRPASLVGAASMGLAFQHFAGSIEIGFHDDLASALAFAGADAETAAGIIEPVRRAFERTPLDEVRELLASEPRLGIDEAARRLGMSKRALQRALQAAETSFREETAHGRFVHAVRLLTLGDEKIEAIARQAGYASAVSLARRVRAEYGMTPSELRESLRRART